MNNFHQGTNMTLERERGRVRLYACGGGGINMGSKIDTKMPSEAFAELDNVFVDTSKSNLDSRIDANQLYLVEGKDGSGQIRRENYADIEPRTREILQKFKPVDLNIVLSTLSGGSGSVIAPCIASELLAKDCLTIIIGIGDDSTKQFALNTLNTLKSYETIAKKRNKPIVMFYLQNSASMTRAVVDARVQELVASLCVLFSRRNRELDSKDLYNWINFHNITSHPPGLASLSLVDSNNLNTLSKLGNLISIATLTSGDIEPTLSMRPEVQYVGYVDETLTDLKPPFHYVTSDGMFADVAASLNAVLRELEEQSAARLKKGGISSHADQATDSGLVL